MNKHLIQNQMILRYRISKIFEWNNKKIRDIRGSPNKSTVMSLQTNNRIKIKFADDANSTGNESKTS